MDELLKAEGRLTDAYPVFQALVKVWLRREIGKMEQQKLYPVPAESGRWAACCRLAVCLQSLGRRGAFPRLFRALPGREPEHRSPH